MVAFSGFPVAALDFYDDLETDNTRSFWTAHKETYEQAVREPMAALVAALEPEFGPAKLFRPYRDVPAPGRTARRNAGRAWGSRRRSDQVAFAQRRQQRVPIRAADPGNVHRDVHRDVHV